MESVSKIKQALIYLGIGMILFILTFPRYEPSYGTGLDPSYVWALNYLLIEDYESLTQMSYPIGPLGFLKYSAAMENNLAWALGFFSFVKLLFILLLLQTSTLFGNRKIYHPLVLLPAIVASYFAGFDLAIIGSVVMALLLFQHEEKNWGYLLLANLLAIVALLIKSYIGITSISVLAAYYLLAIASEKGINRSLMLQFLGSLILFLIIGIIVMSGLNNFLNYIVSIFHLAGGYSSGLALFPANNWWLLSGFLVVMLIFPLIIKNDPQRSAWWLLLLPLFATWKLSIGREDVYHYGAMISFLVVYWAIIIGLNSSFKSWAWLFAPVSILLFSANLSNIPGNAEYQLTFRGPLNFSEAVLKYNGFNEKYKAISEEQVRIHELDPAIRQIIGNSTIDVYPWELSYVAANDLNWSPRKTLEIGASTTLWSVKQGASHFARETSPSYLLFHMQQDRWGGKLGSLDNRYLLNDEPPLISNLTKYYSLIEINAAYLLFRNNRKDTIHFNREFSGFTNTSWNTWLDVPDGKGTITRLHAALEQNLGGRLKTFLYKDEAYFVDYQVEEKKVFSYRILPFSASLGLWVNPLIMDPLEGFSEKVDRVRFRCSNELFVKDSIAIRWEYIHTDEKPELWQMTAADQNGKYLLNSRLDHRIDLPEWKAKIELAERTSSGEMVEKVPEESLSSVFLMPAKDLLNDSISEIVMEAGLKYQLSSREKKDIVLVISIEGSGRDFWKAFPLTREPGAKEWHYAYLRKTLNRQDHQQGLIKVYLWNNSDVPVRIQDFWVDVSAGNSGKK